MIDRKFIINQYYKTQEVIELAQREAAFLRKVLRSLEYLKINPHLLLLHDYKDLAAFKKEFADQLEEIQSGFYELDIDLAESLDSNLIMNIESACNKLRMEFNVIFGKFIATIDTHFATAMKNQGVDFLTTVNTAVSGAKKYLTVPNNNDKQAIQKFILYFENILQPLSLRLISEKEIGEFFPHEYNDDVDEKNECINMAGICYSNKLDKLLQYIIDKLAFRFNIPNTLQNKCSEVNKIASKYISQRLFSNTCATPKARETDIAIAIDFIKNNLDFLTAPYVTPTEFQKWSKEKSKLLSSLSDGLLNFLEPSNQLNEFKYILIGNETDIVCFKVNMLREFFHKPINVNLVNFLAKNLDAHENIIREWREDMKSNCMGKRY